VTTLISVYNSEGCIGRCDARCHEATQPECDCICGGKNHGMGARQAWENTRVMAEQWIEKYQQEHPFNAGGLSWEIPARQPVQMAML